MNPRRSESVVIIENMVRTETEYYNVKQRKNANTQIRKTMTFGAPCFKCSNILPWALKISCYVLFSVVPLMI